VRGIGNLELGIGSCYQWKPAVSETCFKLKPNSQFQIIAVRGSYSNKIRKGGFNGLLLVIFSLPQQKNSHA
jgi:hypothetical protein